MVITFIGTGCGVPSKRRGPASLLINANDDILWFDTGAGSLGKLADAGFSYQDIDYIIYTHFHLDHIGDLAPFLFASKYPLDLRQKELNIIGPKGIAELYDKLIAFYGEQIKGLAYNVNIVEVGDASESFAQGSHLPETKRWELEAIKTAHTPESLGYKIRDKRGKIIVYTGDTGYFDGLIEFASGADLLILECSFPEQVAGHLYPEKVGEIAERAKAKQVAITHLYPVCEPEKIFNIIAKRFSGKILIPEDLMSLEI